MKRIRNADGTIGLRWNWLERVQAWMLGIRLPVIELDRVPIKVVGVKQVRAALAEIEREAMEANRRHRENESRAMFRLCDDDVWRLSLRRELATNEELVSLKSTDAPAVVVELIFGKASDEATTSG